MGKAIVFTSGKGGTGKTTAVAAIGSCLAAIGCHVLCIDCDLGLGNLDLALGIEGSAVTDFTDVLEGNRSLSDAVYRHPSIPGLELLSAPAAPGTISADAMKALVRDAAGKYDFVLLDSPAGIGTGFALAVCGADIGVIVTTWDASSIRDGQRACAALYDAGIGEARLIVNRIPARRLDRFYRSVDGLIDTVGARLLGAVREERAVHRAASAGMALALWGANSASRKFLVIAKRLREEYLKP